MVTHSSRSLLTNFPLEASQADAIPASLSWFPERHCYELSLPPTKKDGQTKCRTTHSSLR